MQQSFSEIYTYIKKICKYYTFLLRFEIIYNQTMIDMNISRIEANIWGRITDIQLSKQQSNEALQMAYANFMSEYKREYKYCTY